MKTEKVNNIQVKPLITHVTDPKLVLGGDITADPFSNTILVAKKRSGKTTVLYTMLKKVCRKGTNVLIFCPTVNNDSTYKLILEMLEKKGCNVSKFTNFIEDGEDIINGLLEELRKPEEEEDPKKKPIKSKVPLKFDDTEEEEAKKREYKPKKVGSKYVIVLDDLGTLLRHKTIANLMKTLRHYLCRTIILTQHLFDLEPASRKQADYVALFRNFNQEKLQTIYEDLDLSMDYEQFLEAYYYATKDPYNFLWVSVRDEVLRKNFNEKIILD